MILCPFCDSEDITIIGNYDHKGFTIENANVISCNNCKEEVIPRNTVTIMEELNYKILGILSPEEIKRKRKLIKKSQEEVAANVRVSRLTYLRWENGQVFQSKSHDQVMRDYFQKEEYNLVNDDWLIKYTSGISQKFQEKQIIPLAAHGDRLTTKEENIKIKMAIQKLKNG